MPRTLIPMNTKIILRVTDVIKGFLNVLRTLSCVFVAMKRIERDALFIKVLRWILFSPEV